jgi:predicted ester cyclase
MSLQDNVQVVLKLFEYFNQNDLKKLDNINHILSWHVKYHDAGIASQHPGVEAVKQAEAGYIKAFPDKKTTIESLLPVDDKVVVRWNFSSEKGKHPVHVTGISIYTVAHGKIVEVWQVWDRFGMYEQLHLSEKEKKVA